MAKPHLKGGTGGKAPSLGCEAFQPLLFSPPKTPASVPTCWVVGRVLLKFLLIITPKARIICDLEGLYDDEPPQFPAIFLASNRR